MKSFKHSLILAALTLVGTAALADDITMVDATPSVRSRDAVLMDLRQAQSDGTLPGPGELALVRTMAPRMTTMTPRVQAGRWQPAQFTMLYGAP